MGKAAHQWVATVQFWDSYARWYKLWIKLVSRILMYWWKREEVKNFTGT